MPTSSLRHKFALTPFVKSIYPASYKADLPLIATTSWQALGDDINGIGSGPGLASQTYPASSRIIAFPFEICDYYLVQKVWWYNGTTATTDSADAGVYDEAGSTLILHAGSTPIATANTLQEVDTTDTLLQPGRYWAAYIQGGTTATPFGYSVTAAILRCTGIAQMAGSGSTLGSTFSPAAVAGNVFPLFGIAGRTLVV